MVNLKKILFINLMVTLIHLEKGRTVKELPSSSPKFPDEGYYVVEYYVMKY